MNSLSDINPFLFTSKDLKAFLIVTNLSLSLVSISLPHYCNISVSFSIILLVSDSSLILSCSPNNIFFMSWVLLSPLNMVSWHMSMNYLKRTKLVLPVYGWTTHSKIKAINSSGRWMLRFSMKYFNSLSLEKENV